MSSRKLIKQIYTLCKKLQQTTQEIELCSVFYVLLYRKFTQEY